MEYSPIQPPPPPSPIPPSPDVPPAPIPTPAHHRLHLPPWAIALLVVIAGTIVVLALTGVFSKKQPPAPAPVVVSPTPTPTPTRILSAIASQSAFLQFETSVASLSAYLQALRPQDPSLSPPVLDLELGFEL